MKNLINGQWVAAATSRANVNPYTGEVIGQSALADAPQVEEAVRSNLAAFALTRRRASFERAKILHAAAAILGRRKQELAKMMSAELGRPHWLNEGEVERGIFTLTCAAEEAKRLGGEYLPLDLTAATRHYSSFTRREAIGPVLAISPFNFPVNLLLHKITPAIATGCPISVKVPVQTPFTPRLIAEVFEEAGTLAGELNLFDCDNEVAAALVADDRFKLLSFTGSPKVGWYLKSIAGKKRVLLELGNASAAIVHSSTSDLGWAAKRLAFGAFAAAGQVCISVQGLLVHDRVYDAFVSEFLSAVRAMPWGDPMLRGAVGGPMIDAASADRVEAWIDEACQQGACALLKGVRSGNVLTPSVLEGVQPQMKVWREEVFGPVVSLIRFGDETDVFALANDSPFGLQTGVFADSLAFVQEAIDSLEVGGVIVNDYPTFRIDHMPYGGIKDSGFGREGLKYAMQEYTEAKLVVFNGQPHDD